MATAGNGSVSVGARVRLARKAQNLSHDQLATLIGARGGKIGRRHLIKIEKGETPNPTTETRRQIAVALGLPEDHFADDDDEEAAALMRDLYSVVSRIAAHERHPSGVTRQRAKSYRVGV